AAIGCGDFKISGGMEAASRLLAACPDLTAIFCANDPMAVGAVKAAAAAGRAVPEELSIIGFDDSLEAQVSQPPLTTIAQPIEEIAAGAMELLRGGGKSEQRIRLSARLVVRHSAAPPTNHSARSDDPTPPAAAGHDSGRVQARTRKRILIAGAGRIGRVHARALARIPGAVITGFSDPDVARAAALAREFGAATFDQVEAALAGGDVDAIIIGSSSDAHLDLVRCAAQHGVHVFCEKPLALTAADIAVAIAACEDAGVILQVGFNRRFDPNAAEIASSVRGGRIGKPLSIRIASRDPAPPPRDFLRRSGGMFHDMAIHDFDLASHILGEEVVEVMAMGGCLIDPMFTEEGDVDVATTILRFASGAVGVVENTRATPYGYDQRLEVLGTEGALESENQTANRVIFRGPAGQVGPLPLPFFLERYETAFQHQMQAFVELIAAAAPRPEPVVSGRDALRAHLIADAATESLRSGRPARVAAEDVVPMQRAMNTTPGGSHDASAGGSGQR
ncbi:MAG: inositol 2-dehydrogenase, partial [Kiloniellaceae bacterium]|nr:inositol 2-dehydrogenase [Kiloniellaceae bacterium]